MGKKSKVLMMSLSIIVVLTLTGYAQQATQIAYSSVSQLRQEAKSLEQQKQHIISQLKELQSQEDPLRKQIRSIQDRINTIRKKISPTPRGTLPHKQKPLKNGLKKQS